MKKKKLLRTLEEMGKEQIAKERKLVEILEAVRECGYKYITLNLCNVIFISDYMLINKKSKEWSFSDNKRTSALSREYKEVLSNIISYNKSYKIEKVIKKLETYGRRKINKN